MVPQDRVLALVVVAAGHRHGARAGQRGGGVDVRALRVMAEAEIPHPVLFHTEPGGVLLGVQHTYTFFYKSKRDSRSVSIGGHVPAMETPTETCRL